MVNFTLQAEILHLDVVRDSVSVVLLGELYHRLCVDADADLCGDY